MFAKKIVKKFSQKCERNPFQKIVRKLTSNFCTKFDLLVIFFKRRASHHFKELKFRNLRAFEFFFNF